MAGTLCLHNEESEILGCSKGIPSVLLPRLLSKAQRLHQQLGGDGGVDGRPPKPKGMHCRTYWRKVEEMEAVHNASLLEAMLSLGIRDI